MLLIYHIFKSDFLVNRDIYFIHKIKILFSNIRFNNKIIFNIKTILKLYGLNCYTLSILINRLYKY